MPELTIQLPYETICLDPDRDDNFDRCVGWSLDDKLEGRCRTKIAEEYRDVSKAMVRELLDVSGGRDEFDDCLDVLVDLLPCLSHKSQCRFIRIALIEALEQSTATHTLVPVTGPPVNSFGPTVPNPTPQVSNTLHTLATTPSISLRRGFQRMHSNMRPKKLRKSGLTPRCTKAGFIYAFRDPAPDVQGLLKIGYTELKYNQQREDKGIPEIERRIAEFKKDCRRNPKLITDINQRVVRHAWRAEQLVFAELSHLRWREKECEGSNCNSHIEWFEVDEAQALDVIEMARQWMEKDYGVARRRCNEIERQNSKTAMPSPPTLTPSLLDTDNLLRRLHRLLLNVAIPDDGKKEHCTMSLEDLLTARSIVVSMLPDPHISPRSTALPQHATIDPASSMSHEMSGILYHLFCALSCAIHYFVLLCRVFM